MTDPTSTQPTNTQPLPDDTLSEEDLERQSLQLTEEEKRGTIPQTTEVTAMAIATSRAQSNPVVERSKPR